MNELTTKWNELLENKDIKEIKNKKVKEATAIMLENQFNWLKKSGQLNEDSSHNSGALTPTGNAYSENGFFSQVAIPMVRRTFPELIAHEIVGVQPMNAPVGLAFAMRFIADQSYNGVVGAELGYNNIDPAYTGSIETSTGEALGSNVIPNEAGLGIGDGTQIKEVSMTLEKVQIEAKTRKMKSRWSVEVAQDVENMHGINIEAEMMDILAYEISAEIDREIIAAIRAVAVPSTKDYTTDFDGRWESEKYRNMWNAIIRQSNSIAISTRRGPGNFAVANPTVCAALETLANFAIHPTSDIVNTATTGVARVGSIDGRMNLYRDTFQAADDIVIGFKGNSTFDTGIVYCPYVALMLSKATDYASFQPSIGMLSRYAIVNHIFGASNYYRKLTITSMPG